MHPFIDLRVCYSFNINLLIKPQKIKCSLGFGVLYYFSVVLCA